MFRNPRFASLALVLLSLGFASNASAQEAPSAQASFQVIGPLGAPAVGNCLIVGDNGFANAPSRRHWGQANAKPQHCGFARAEDFLANRQAIFNIGCLGTTNQCFIEQRAVRKNVNVIKCMVSNTKTNAVSFRDGPCTYTNVGKRFIKDDALWLMDIDWSTTSFRPVSDPGKCLIFNNRGYDTKPTLYRWNDVPNDTNFCGLGSKRALSLTGQAMFAWVDL